MEKLTNKKLVVRGYYLQMLSIVLVFTCFLSKWMAIPTLISGILGASMFITGVSRESKQQIKELLDEYNKSNIK